MTRRSDAERKQLRNIVYNSVPDDWTRWSRIWENNLENLRGIKNKTVFSRYLVDLVSFRYVLHDPKTGLYKRNPTIAENWADPLNPKPEGLPETAPIGPSFAHKFGDWMLYRKEAGETDAMRKHDQRIRYLVKSAASRDADYKKNPVEVELAHLIHSAFRTAESSYARMLNALAKASSERLADLIVDLFFECELNSLMERVAKEVWRNRKNVRMPVVFESLSRISGIEIRWADER